MPNRLFLLSTLLLCMIPVSAAAGKTRLLGEPWLLHVIDSTSQGADGVRLGDINQDGRPDIVTGWEEGGLVRLYVNPGFRHSAGPWPRVTVGKVADVEDAVLVDLDSDGRFEIVSSCEGGNRAMYVHRFDENRGELLNPASWRTERLEISAGVMQWMFCTPLRLGGDNRPALVAGGKNENAAIGILTAGTDTGLWQWNPLVSVGWIMSIQALDMDGDGDSDILYSDRKGPHCGVYWLANPGSVGAAWKDNLIGGAGYEVMFLDMADLDGDGELELATAAKPDRILIFDKQPGGWRTQELQYPDGTGGAKALAIADLDMNGRPDLVASCESAVECSGVFWISVDKWPDPSKADYFDIAGTRGIKFDRIECLDLDGDGDLDVLTTDERDGLGVIWYENPTR